MSNVNKKKFPHSVSDDDKDVDAVESVSTTVLQNAIEQIRANGCYVKKYNFPL